MFMPKAYDRAITIFSPEGRLYQVEYALELVKRGAPVTGIACSSGVVLAANETPESILEDPNYFRKIYQLDDHLASAISGLSSDARVLIGQARVYCQSNKLLYDEAVDVEILARRIGDMSQRYTQHAGVRPFGVTMVIAGVDATGPRVITTDPSGAYRGFKAIAVGRRNDEANKLLEDLYTPELTLEESIKLAIKAIKTASQNEITKDTVKLAIIDTETKTFKRLTPEETEGYLN